MGQMFTGKVSMIQKNFFKCDRRQEEGNCSILLYYSISDQKRLFVPFACDCQGHLNLQIYT